MEQTISRACDGILVAPVGAEGLWGAFRELRAAMRGLPGPGHVRTAFVTAFARDGRPAMDSGHAALLVAGYHIGSSN